jgi:Ca2+-binding EF-hand superfamily protein
MNLFVNVSISKKELKRTFDIIDRSKNGRVRLEDIKNIVSLISKDEDEDMELEEEVESGKLKDIFEEVKEKLEKKNITLETVVYD